jgi:calcineurin-like phosphoesterase family protein
MDMAMIREWNGVVSPFDKVYHLGDFGNPEVLKFLNGEIILIPGNYEEDLPDLSEFTKRGVKIYREVCIDRLKDSTSIVMAHKPSVARNVKHRDLWLFGHTHGRQHVKNWPGIDVGVDGNHFRPVSEDEILFWKEAITKYYDFENWI